MSTSLVHVIDGSCIGIPQQPTGNLPAQGLPSSTTTVAGITQLNGSLNVINNVNYYGPLAWPWQLITGPPCVGSSNLVGDAGQRILLPSSGTSEERMLPSKPSTVFSSTDVKEEDEVQVSCVQDRRTKKSPSVSSDTMRVSKRKRLLPSRSALPGSPLAASSTRLGGSLSQLLSAVAASQSQLQLAGKAGLKSVE